MGVAQINKKFHLCRMLTKFGVSGILMKASWKWNYSPFKRQVTQWCTLGVSLRWAGCSVAYLGPARLRGFTTDIKSAVNRCKSCTCNKKNKRQLYLKIPFYSWTRRPDITCYYRPQFGQPTQVLIAECIDH
jgi:hypothetical protein